MQGKKLNLAGKLVLITGTVMAGLAAIVGCTQTPETTASWRRVVGLGWMAGSSSPNLNYQQQKAADATGRAMWNANRDQAIRDSGGNVIVNVQEQGYQQQIQQEPIYTIEIYNLDTGEKEIEMVSIDYLDYFSGKKDLAKKYRIVEKTNSMVRRNFIVESRVEKESGEEYNNFYCNGEFNRGTPRNRE